MNRIYNAKVGVFNALYYGRLALYMSLFLGFLNVLEPLSYAGDTQKGVLSHTKVAFGRDCEELLIGEINSARKEVLIAIYSITRRDITRAIVKAHKRKLRVVVKYDRKSADWPAMQEAVEYMKKKGVTCVAVDLKGDYAKMHHKFAVIDSIKTLTGSYNFTTSASISSYENIVCIESRKIASSFAKEFEAVKSK